MGGVSMNTKYVLIIQCDIAHRRCSGFAFTNAFYNRDEVFKDYDDATRYISFTCGGCCGKGVASKLEHFSKKVYKKNNNADLILFSPEPYRMIIINKTGKTASKLI